MGWCEGEMRTTGRRRPGLVTVTSFRKLNRQNRDSGQADLELYEQVEAALE